jgi:hypothetical protein
LCCTAGPGIPAIGCGPGETLQNGVCVPGFSMPPGQACGFVKVSTAKCTDAPATKTPKKGPACIYPSYDACFNQVANQCGTRGVSYDPVTCSCGCK